MGLTLRITSLQMSDGSDVPVPVEGIVVFVGPNNTGKTAALRDIATRLDSGIETRVVTGLEVAKGGTEDDLGRWLEDHCFAIEREGRTFYRRMHSQELELPTIRGYWQSGPPFHQFSPMLRFLGGTEERLGLATSTQSYDLIREHPSTPLQVLYKRRDLEEELAGACREAFGSGIVVNRVAGSQIHLHLGEPPDRPEFPWSEQYVERLSELPLVQGQGDGVRSFVGIMLAVTASQYPAVMIDEPDAFLHPPQARLIGRKLASLVPKGTQVFIATHSSDLLQGLLAAPDANVTVVRILREGRVNPTAILDPEKIRELWTDPILRYSNILDGLFHKAVVICESDADCRFYASVLGDCFAARAEAQELLFVHCGGKDRIPTVVRALRAVNVPVRVVADFDVLREEATIKAIVEVLGGVWTDFEARWRTIDAALSGTARNPSLSFVKEQIASILDGAEGTMLTPELQEEIRAVIKAEGGWADAKRAGVGAVPQGQPSESCNTIIRDLSSRGLLVVDVGELERFIPEVPGHGPAWVNEVHRRGLHRDPDSRAAEFVRQLLDSLEQPL